MSTHQPTAVVVREHRRKYEFEHEGEIPLPESRRRESEVFDALDAVPVRGALKLNRGPSAMRAPNQPLQKAARA
jgi:hypothetical protein